MEKIKYNELAEEFKKRNTYILEGYLNMCQADLPRKKRCYLELTMDSNAYTDGNMVHLGLFSLRDVFEYVMARYPDKDPEALFALLNEYLLGHENQHTRSTRQKDWIAAQDKSYRAIVTEMANIRGDKTIFRLPEDYDAYVESLSKSGYDISKGMIVDISHFITNSLEDGRIERIRSVKRPGFGTTMRFVRAALYEMNSAEEYLKGGSLKPENIPKKDCLYIIMAQLLSLATSSIYERDFFLLFCNTDIGKDAQRLIPHVRAGVNSGCCRGIVVPAEEIAKIFAPYILESAEKNTASDQTDNAMNRMAQSGSGNGNEEYNTVASEEETDDGKPSDVLSSTDGLSINSDNTDRGMNTPRLPNGSDADPDNINRASATSESSCDQTNANAHNNGSDTQAAFYKTGLHDGGRIDNFIERTAKGVEEKQFNEMMNALDKAMEDAATLMNGISGQISAYKTEAKRKIGSVKETTLPEFKPQTTKTVFPGVRFKEVYRKYKLDTPMPYDLQVRADKFEKDIEDLFHNQEVPEVRCMNTGKIDPAGIYKLGLNMIDCFEQEMDAPEFSGCAYFLCDNSGSMGYGIGTKRYYANTALAVIEQGFSKHMPIKMVAFDESGSGIIHEVLKNWDEDLPVSGAYNFAIKGRGGCGNADAYSIRIATEELLARPEEERMLVVLSDGAPSCVTCDGKLTAEEEVKMAVEDARAAGIRVISIFFDEDRDDSIIEAFHFMYERFNSIVCKPDEIEDKLASLMQTFVFG